MVNEVQFARNGFARPVSSYQAHSGAVNTGTSPKVQYAYADGSGNTTRPTAMTYPDSRVIDFDYGTAGSTADAASRMESIKESSVDLAKYAYMGLVAPVEVDYTEPDLRYTLVGTAGGDDPDTGDIYRGMDRFGRTKDSLWHDYGSATDASRIQYGYDRVSSRTFRKDTLDTTDTYNSAYRYDGSHRLKCAERGKLNSENTAVETLKFAECWSLDQTGNWRHFRQDNNGDRSWNLTQTRTANQVNEITDIAETAAASWATPAYDPAGNMTIVPQQRPPSHCR